MPYARHTRSARPELIFFDTGTASFSSLFSLLQLSLRLQGRTFGAPGLTALSREQRGRTRAVEREERPRCPAVGGRGSSGVSPLRGGSFSPRPSDGSPTARRLPRTAPPVTGPLAVPAVSRCRARQHHDQAINVAASAPAAGRMSQSRARNAAHCPDWPLQPQRCFASRCAGRACGAPLTLEPLPAQRA
jgi:hypothetical protein